MAPSSVAFDVWVQRQKVCERGKLTGKTHFSSYLLYRVGQNRISVLYMNVYLVISLPRKPHILRVGMVLSNSTLIPFARSWNNWTILASYVCLPYMNRTFMVLANPNFTCFLCVFARVRYQQCRPSWQCIPLPCSHATLYFLLALFLTLLLNAYTHTECLHSYWMLTLLLNAYTLNS